MNESANCRLASFLVILSLIVAGAHGQAQSTKVISGGTLIDAVQGTSVEDAVVVIEGTRITQVGTKDKTKIPEGAQVVDARGKFIIPGLADMHNHLSSGESFLPQGDRKKTLARLLAWGVTLVLEPGGLGLRDFADLKSATADDAASMSHLFAMGPGFGTLGSQARPQTPDDARMILRKLKAANVDAVKLAYDDLSWLTKQTVPPFKPEVMAAIIDEAHQQGLKVFVHAPMLKYAKEVLRAGADRLLHGIISDPVDDEFVALMKKNRAVYVSTLALFEDCADVVGWARRQAAFDERGAIAKTAYDTLTSPEALKQREGILNNAAYVKERLPILRANLKKLFEAGVPIVSGTDSGFWGVLSGVSSQIELVLHVEAGLKPIEALRAATINAAQMIGREKDLGSIETGKTADLVILDASPLADISNVRKIHRVIKGGVVYDPAQLLQQK
jgi:imidazolonepropionase-like amidohydrolase